ncbi:HEAT repeat domain-containing protein [bacterium]|nr:HEAT repeat domain-containing protein [bacterium]
MGIFGPPNIAEMKAKKDVSGLVKALDHKKYKIRMDAAKALGEIGDSKAVKPLFEILGGGNYNTTFDGVVKSALKNICGPAYFDQLIAALSDENSGVRKAAAEALGDLGDTRAVLPLVAALSDNNSDVRREAVEALRELGDSKAVQPIIATLADENDGVREAAIEALGAFGDSRAVEPLVAALKEEGFLWKPIVRALCGIGDPRAAEPLIKSLNVQDYELRNLIIEYLIDVKAVMPLIDGLKIEDESIHHAIAEALGQIGDARAVEPLFTVLGEKYNDVAARIALTNICGSKYVDKLIAALSHEDPEVRKNVAVELGIFNEAKAVEPLITSLSDKNLEVRKVVVESLGALSDDRAIEPLKAMLNDGDEALQKAIENSLEKLGVEIHGKSWEAESGLKAGRTISGHINQNLQFPVLGVTFREGEEVLVSQPRSYSDTVIVESGGKQAEMSLYQVRKFIDW